ncbi:hypothetical protein SI65_07098 [Aspergillus cristatus]|uniref:Zn(2)-C6 fungal-type domain-containing protein n=1 Tax=Aspergillus cristatus TaxID=573508 RepID=A0A1E3B8X4_ASPCR|nr:hypothetical protein SI65_07098 [Aspergillus cristatus]
MDRIAIPRAGPLPPPATRRRLERACQACCDRKIRCNGERPTCRHCLNTKANCVYHSNRLEEDKDALQQLKSQNEQYKSLLEKIAGRGFVVTLEERKSCYLINIWPEAKKRKRSPSPGREESFSSASSTGSLDALDVVDEDINRNQESRATGFVGKNSEVSWLQSLDIEAERVNHPGHTHGRRSTSGTSHDNHIAFKSYHADERPIVVECEGLNPYDIPPKHTADVYYNIYFSFVDAHFPIVRKSLFTVQYERYYTEPFLKPGKKWLCVLNLIFAIASRYCAFVGKYVPDGSDDRIFFSRAKMLSANDNIDIQTFSRAWKMIRIASNSAIALGINMRNVDDKTDVVSKESRCRLWCSIFMLEHSLTTMTGRASSLDELFSVHAPVPFTEGSFSDSPASLRLSDESEREKIAN